jgi:hypothetical protein
VEYSVLKTVDGLTYDKVTNTPLPAKIELAKGAPIVLFGGNQYYNNGFTYYSIDGETFNNLNLIAYDVLGNPALDANGYVSDVRNFDVVSISGIVSDDTIPPSGSTFSRVTGLVQHNLYEGRSALRVARYDNNPIWHSPDLLQVYTISGCMDKFETSNFGYRKTPYMFFTTISGITYSGDASEFYQIDYDTKIMHKYMTNFPNAVVNVIRLDDRV